MIDEINITLTRRKRRYILYQILRRTWLKPKQKHSRLLLFFITQSQRGFQHGTKVCTVLPNADRQNLRKYLHIVMAFMTKKYIHINGTNSYMLTQKLILRRIKRNKEYTSMREQIIWSLKESCLICRFRSLFYKSLALKCWSY